MIEKIPFGKTGHLSSRTIFGSVSLGIQRFAEANIQLAPPTSKTQITDDTGEGLELPRHAQAPSEG